MRRRGVPLRHTNVVQFTLKAANVKHGNGWEGISVAPAYNSYCDNGVDSDTSYYTSWHLACS